MTLMIIVALHAVYIKAAALIITQLLRIIIMNIQQLLINLTFLDTINKIEISLNPYK